MPLIVEEWPISRLVEYARNPRRNDPAVDRMAAAIREFGFRVPIVAKSDGTIADSHLRYKAARKLGLETVPVALADDLTESQIRAFRLLANRSANWAEWDRELLKLEFEELHFEGVDLTITGFEPVEIEHAIDLSLPSANAGAPPAERGQTDYNGEWQGMPEFVQEDQLAAYSVKVNFQDIEALQAFSALVGQPLTEHTRFIWYPEQEPLKTADQRYVAEP